jgi:precorrin-2 dehydrogenase/sirohydrochlorin ferrochelatase
MFKPHYYPILVDLSGQKVVVVGGGNVAQRKIESLLQYGPEVLVVARELTPGLSRYTEQGKITHLGREFQKDQVDGAILVIAATDDPALNRLVSASARDRGILVNAVDQPGDCTFIVPSVLKRGDLLIAVSTSGKSPALARRVREDLESLFGEEYEGVLILMGNLRKEILSRGLGQEEKKGIFENIVNSGILRMIREKDWESVAFLLSEALERPVSGEETVKFLKRE